MTIRERIVEKVRHLPEEVLPEVYEIVDKFGPKDEPEGLLKRLQRIKFDGPPDFAENFDLYMNGEKKYDEEMDKIKMK